MIGAEDVSHRWLVHRWSPPGWGQKILKPSDEGACRYQEVISLFVEVLKFEGLFWKKICWNEDLFWRRMMLLPPPVAFGMDIFMFAEEFWCSTLLCGFYSSLFDSLHLYFTRHPRRSLFYPFSCYRHRQIREPICRRRSVVVVLFTLVLLPSN